MQIKSNEQKRQGATTSHPLYCLNSESLSVSVCVRTGNPPELAYDSGGNAKRYSHLDDHLAVSYKVKTHTYRVAQQAPPPPGFY